MKHYGRIEEYYGKIRSIWMGLISIPAHAWLKGESNKDTLIASIKQADRECGSCGCELDPLYKRALVLLNK